MGIPAALLFDLGKSPTDRPVALLLRHAARHPITDPEDPYSAGLTDEGIRAAEELGGVIQARFTVGRAISSPVERCTATLHAILRGAGWTGKVQTDERLSHPFIAPGYAMVEKGWSKVMLPPQVRAVLQLMLRPASEPAGLDLLVTHDTVVGAVAGGVLEAAVSGEDWPGYLEGVLAWRSNGQVIARWRGVEYILNEQLVLIR